jgi:Tubulin-tyrosine ligase family
MSALDRLKQIQSNFKRQWNGIDCGVSGRVGTSNFVNKKRTFIIPETFVEEEERQRTISKIFNKLRDFEEGDPHRPSTTTSAGVSQSSSSAGASFNKTAA